MALKLLAAPVVFAVPSAPLSADNEQLARGRAQAEIVKPLKTIALSDLSFGTVAVGQSREGSVTISPDGSAASYSNAARANCTSAAMCGIHRADFSVTGHSERTYRVKLPAQVKAKGMTTGAELIVHALKMRSLNHPGMIGGGRLDRSGKDRFFVGGTLLVPAGTQSDVFRAALPVMVSYD